MSCFRISFNCRKERLISCLIKFLSIQFHRSSSSCSSGRIKADKGVKNRGKGTGSIIGKEKMVTSSSIDSGP